MPTRNIDLTPEQDAFVEEVVRAGKYRTAGEAMRDALRLWQERLETETLAQERLRVQIRAGLDALERGAFMEVDEADLDAALDRLKSAPVR